MALPTAPAAEEQVKQLFIDACKPIWPNLMKRQTRIEFAAKQQFKKQQAFQRSCLTPNNIRASQGR